MAPAAEKETRLGWSLGLQARSTAEVVEHIARGFELDALRQISDHTALSQREVAKVIGTSSRTLARRKKNGRLNATESDRLYRIARLFEHAVDVFGGDEVAEEEARRWLHAPQWALGDETPLAYARTETGAREVEALLDRIDYGVLA